MTAKPSDSKNKIIFFLVFLTLVLGIAQLLTLRELSRRPLAGKEMEEIIIEPGAETIPVHAGTLAVIIDDFGYRNDRVSEGFLELGAELTFAVIPGHEYSQYFSRRARENGFEVIVHMPFEANFQTSGEEDFILSTDMTSMELEKRIRNVLDHLPEARGMNNHQGSKATADSRVMGVLGSLLKKHNKYYIDSRTTTETVAETTMRSLAVPTNRRHVFLDNNDDADLIRIQLEELAEKARFQGRAVGIGHARPNTLAVLKKVIPEFQKDGLHFAFASEVVD